jgi:hypothetical protein
VTAENALKYVGAGLAITNVYNNQPIGTCTENNVSEWTAWWEVKEDPSRWLVFLRGEGSGYKKRGELTPPMKNNKRISNKKQQVRKRQQEKPS